MILLLQQLLQDAQFVLALFHSGERRARGMLTESVYARRETIETRLRSAQSPPVGRQHTLKMLLGLCSVPQLLLEVVRVNFHRSLVSVRADHAQAPIQGFLRNTEVVPLA